MPASRIRGYDAGRFSFNVKGGRCENCEGDGLIKIEMHFLADVYVECEVCQGKRYNRETLEITYKGKNIADVLDMTVDEAARFFRNVPTVSDKLSALQDVGLGYLRLGQAARRFPAAKRSGSSSRPSWRKRRPAAPSTFSTNRRPACILPISRSCSRC